jgi:hypothetical protein
LSDQEYTPRKKKRDLLGNYIEGPKQDWRAKVLNFKLVKAVAWILFLFNGLALAALLYARNPGMALVFGGNCWIILAFMKVRRILDSYINQSEN